MNIHGLFFSGLFTDYDTLAKWLLPVLLTVVLIGTQRYFKNSLVLPSFYILTLVLFHFIVAIIPTLSLDALRQAGWIFLLPTQIVNGMTIIDYLMSIKFIGH